MKRGWKDIGIGFLLGSTMSIPGVSGGTMAMAIGYYKPIMKAAANLRKKRCFFFLLRILAGGLGGFLLGAGTLNYTLELLPITVTLLFSGAVLAGIYVLGRETLKKGVSLNGILFFLLGVLLVLTVDQLPKGQICTSPLLSVLWGFFLATGLILPGISTSHLLTVFGLYGTVTDISYSNLLRLIPLAMGVFLGIILLTKPLANAMDRFERECNWILLGFSAGSLKSLIAPCLTSPQISYIPWFQTINGVILGVGAAFLILKIQKTEAKKL